MKPVPTVRDALDGDAAAIAAVHVESWQATYRGMLPDAYLDSLKVEDRLGFWESALPTRLAARRMVLVVEDDAGELVGFSASRPAEEEPTTCELGGLYLRSTAWGLGLGRLLLSTTADRFRQDGFRRAILWVHPANTRARHVYEVAGWMCDSVERTETVWGVAAPEVRYSLDL
jgi:GNAT superfamily N-acetyltransferase